MLSLIGATGDTAEVAALFTWIVLPSTPLLGLGMCATGLLRAAGDPKRAMYTTLWFGGVILVARSAVHPWHRARRAGRGDRLRNRPTSRWSPMASRP